jgi:protein tyrosine/serine phosphatase
MPQQDVIQDHFTALDQASWDAAIAALEAIVLARLHNLSAEENSKFGTINETNKLLVDKVQDYRNTQPALSSGDVDWVEFKADAFDRKFLETGAQRLMAMATGMMETKRMHDYDNYQNSLVDYSYTQYKNRTSPGLGYDTKEAELKQFFPNS